MSGFASKMTVLAVVLAAGAFYLANSQRVPLTGRWRFNYLSDELAERMHPRAAEEIPQEVQKQGGYILPDSDPRTRLVRNVMRRLIPVSGLTHLNWKIYVIADDGRWFLRGTET